MEKEFPVRKGLRLPDHDYALAGYYFVTVCTRVRNKDILCSLSVGDGLCAVPPAPDLTPIGRAVDAALQKIPTLYPGVGIDIYCIMPDHIHLIATLPGRPGDRPYRISSGG